MKTPLQIYIDDFGQADFARSFKVSPQVVNNWYHLKALPNAETMVAIVKRAKGKLSYADIIQPYVQYRLKNRK